MIRHIFLLLFPILSASGQIPDNNERISQDLNQQKNYLRRLYYESVTVPNEMINGKEYLPYFSHSKTTPLLFSGQRLNAILTIKNREFKNIRLQYDTYLDELIYTDTTRMVNFEYPRIALNKDIVDGFNIEFNGDSMLFKYLKFPENTENELENGFYEVAYDGVTRFIIKHKSDKYIRQALNEYDYSPEGYILNGDKFKEIKNNKAFLQMFREWSAEIKEFLKKSKININKAGKYDIIKVLVYIDSMKKSEALTK
ncbi:MAG: hypothetical protein MUO72_16435 [Bacteroidales bacterium]|nr:hypothetical protein [Bacteroidales bacterium]